MIDLSGRQGLIVVQALLFVAVDVTGRRAEGFDARHEQWLGLMALDLYKAMASVLFLQGGGRFKELFVQAVILHGREFLKRDRYKHGNISDGFRGAVAF